MNSELHSVKKIKIPKRYFNLVVMHGHTIKEAKEISRKLNEPRERIMRKVIKEHNKKHPNDKWPEL